MDNNYFSDITELFIKAKKAEKIEINPHSKAAIREMLAYKVDEMKTAEEAPTGNFFNKWKFQLMGVPASVFAVFLLVFAFQNLQITMPKEDFAPGGATEANEADILDEKVVKDTPVIEEADEPAPKPKPELMVIDYGETTQPATTTQIKTGGGTYTPPTYTQPTTTVQPEAAPYVAPVEQPVETDQKTAQSTQDYTSNSSSGSSSNSSQPSTGGGNETPPPTTSYTPTTSEPTYDIYTPTTSGGYTMISEDLSDVDTTLYTIPVPQVDVPRYEINPNEVGNMMDGGILLPKTSEPNEDGTVNEFRNPFNPLVPEFDTEALNTIEKPDTLSNVNVHYLNRDQAAVEVIDTNSTRWYMFETIDGKWTVTQKFD